MDLTLTVTDGATNADLRVIAADDAPAAELLAEIRTVLAADPAAAITVDGAALPDEGTIADCGLLSGLVAHVGPPPQLRHRPAAAIVVTSGVDSPRRRQLDQPRLLIGRAAHCDLVLTDGAVSREHLLVEQADGATTITDLDSANGVLLDGVPLSAGVPMVITTGSVVEVGGTELRCEAESGPVASEAAGIVIHRTPRLDIAPPTAEVMFPPPVAARPPTRMSLVAALAPLFAGLGLSLLLHQWQFLAFTALSPLMVLGQAAGDRLTSRRTHRRSRREFDVATSAAHAALARELVAERRRRHDAAPDLARLARAGARRDPLLWQRRLTDADGLRVRLGRADLPSEARLVNGPDRPTIEVPLCLSLLETGVFGICGPVDLTSGLARSVLIQATTLHSPRELRVMVLAPGQDSRWRWTRWLPHVAARDEDCSALFGFDDEQVARRLAELGSRRRDRIDHILVVVEAGPRSIPTALAEVLDDPPAATSVVWCASRSRELPAGCRAIATLVPGPRPLLRLVRADSPEVVEAALEQLSAEPAEAAARGLAPLLDGGAERRSVATGARWTEVNRIALRSPTGSVRSLLDRWSCGPSTEITLGRDAAGLTVVDLTRDGPHALIAGMTGAGKSELLVGIVASLAAANRPDQVALLLIDHKGGAAFGRCARLPHSVGLVTDLDAASTQRALQSLTAELRRRERILAEAGAADLEAYTETRGDPPLARLVIIVDEFAALVEEHPEFVSGLVGIAQRGRSLGVHLILATQRPDGVVSTDIRANTRLRICLGVAREQDSRDVIDSPVAAQISRRDPGRGYLRIGPGELREFHAARVGGNRPAEDNIVVAVEPVTTLGEPARRAAEAPGDSELDALVEAAIQASAVSGCRPLPAPWLPPLPEQLALSTLAQPDQPGLAAWGTVDLPAAGRQEPLLIDVDRPGTLLIAGTGRSGRTTAALSAVMALAAKVSPERLNLWAIDAGTGLAGLARLPHCGAVIRAHEADRVDSLLHFLGREVSERRRGSCGGRALALVIDDWDGLLSGYDDRDRGGNVDRLLRLAAEGPSAMVHLIVTGDRGLLTGRLAGVATEKFVLRLADRTDVVVIGLPLRDLPRDLPAGRGVRASDLAVVQFAQPGGAAGADAERWPPPTPRVRRFDPLPTRIGLDELRRPGPAATAQVLLGVGVEDNAVVTTTTDAMHGFLVAGPAGSGRSSALLSIASQLTDRRLAVSCPSGSPLAGVHGTVLLPRDDQAHAVAILDALFSDAETRPHVLIDDLDLLPDGALSVRLEELLRAGPRADCVVAASATVDASAAAFRGPLALARRCRTGLLLRPDSRNDGDLYGIRLPAPAGTEPPGRGWLVRRGLAERLQVAVAVLGALGGPPSPVVLSGGGHLRNLDVNRAGLGGDLGGARLLG
jgi:S-DNA-T family DNA segregation ATPase FtsK/SpoIIIE